MTTPRYRGDGLPPDGNPDHRAVYLADPRLVKAVNMAIALRRPLLVKGPPGCGKTRLAEAVARELGLPFYPWYVKSGERARDGLYTIDALRRLQDAQLHKPEAQRLAPYVRLGPLGEAIARHEEAVVLIDEIDKADIDFPNDLLREVDEHAFTITELDPQDDDPARNVRRENRSQKPPIVLVTSNDEKELPEAFLRRCLFHFIDFPSPERLVAIVRAHRAGLDGGLIEAAVARLCEFREIKELRKPPSTSELLDWVRLLEHYDVKAEALRTALPECWEALFKHLQDLKCVEERAREVRP